MINLAEQFGVIKVTGADAAQFLQSQLSNDITLLNNTSSQLSSYNSPKGRVYAVFRIVQSDDDYLFITTRSQIDFLVKRLSMFVMRSNVTISDESDNFILYGAQPTDLETNQIQAVNEVAGVSKHGDIIVTRIPGEGPRYILLLKADSADSIAIKNEESIEDWLYADIKAGIPHIYPETQEAFIAQMLNLDISDGINFEKGCYPGQEIVARMKYLGKLKKRMFVVSFSFDGNIDYGQAIYGHENEQSIGQIVYTSKQDERYQALAVINIEQTKMNLFIDSAKECPIKIEHSFIEEGA